MRYHVCPRLQIVIKNFQEKKQRKMATRQTCTTDMLHFRVTFFFRKKNQNVNNLRNVVNPLMPGGNKEVTHT